MFLINSRYPLLSATLNCSTREVLHNQRPTLSRSYGGNVLSSLTIVLSSALVFSTHLPESVYGTGDHCTRLEDFLGSLASIASLRVAPSMVSYLMITPRRIYQPRLTTYFQHHPIDAQFSLLRPSIAQTYNNRYRNINLFSIGYASRPRLRSRLTLRGLPLPRKP